MNAIAVNPAVFNTTIAGIEADMTTVMTMNESQRQYWDFLLGRTRVAPSLTLVNQLEVDNYLTYVIDGFPIADFFDDVRFPAIRVVRQVRRQQLRLENTQQSPPVKRDNRQRRRATRSVASSRRD